MKKAPLVIAALLISAACVCLIFVTTAWAGLTGTQKHELQICNHTYDQCVKACPDELSSGRNQIGKCQQACLNQYYDCRQKAGIPGYVPGPGGSMGQASPPGKSRPTPTPRKGPDKIGTSGVGHSSPTPTPTPRSTPTKGHN